MDSGAEKTFRAETTIYLVLVQAEHSGASGPTFEDPNVPHLQTVIQLLENIESCQLKSLTKGPFSQEEPKPADQLSEAA